MPAVVEAVQPVFHMGIAGVCIGEVAPFHHHTRLTVGKTQNRAALGTLKPPGGTAAVNHHIGDTRMALKLVETAAETATVEFHKTRVISHPQIAVAVGHGRTERENHIREAVGIGEIVTSAVRVHHNEPFFSANPLVSVDIFGYKCSGSHHIGAFKVYEAELCQLHIAGKHLAAVGSEV